MKISRESRRTARELFKLSLVDGHVDASRATEISGRLADEKPRDFLQILKEFTRLIRLELAKRHAIVESAAALDAATKSDIETNLKHKFGPDITAEFHTTPALLGGLRIKLGSDVWDGSVSGRLAALSQQL
ncbi:MAG: F0F1 ATP synthase subunit delta [Terrimicrobiaceae bacterium]